MSRYPKAIWHPWKYGILPAYYKGLNKPVAAVLHISQGYIGTALQWASEAHFGASWHFSVDVDGTVYQHLDFEDGGYHAGVFDNAPEPTWALWKGDGHNINHYTIGVERMGFYADFPYPEAQDAAIRDLCRWLASELGLPFDRDHFTSHAEIDVVNRPNDFARPEDRETFYRYMFQEEDEVTRQEYEDLLLAVFSGNEDRGSTREERLAKAAGRVQQRARFEEVPEKERRQSVADEAGSSSLIFKDHIDNHSAGVGIGLKRGDKVTLT